MSGQRHTKTLAVLEDNAQEWQYGYLCCNVPQEWKEGWTLCSRSFTCFGKGCMNRPLIFHNYTTLQGPNITKLRGSFYGSWDLDSGFREGIGGSTSYYSVTWKKEVGKGAWVFHNVLRTSKRYPWLMLYLRSDATTVLSGGYHYETREISKIIWTR
uniref:DUF7705 domain-containing protein n=1 Tax=Nelumbo nucifera TaxID=4432 RepID=A0A822ZCH7_NELNU|nr:TPA_asm: hypothetical protein HUJ06_002164 [Nelumbo nucifera]